MAAKSVTKLLTEYFNSGDGKRSTAAWMQELKALTTEQKRELAEGVCKVTGDTVT